MLVQYERERDSRTAEYELDMDIHSHAWLLFAYEAFNMYHLEDLRQRDMLRLG